MDITCYIIDDEAHSIAIIENHIKHTPGLTLVGVSTNPLEALAYFSGKHVPELTFLDIDMPQINGLDFADLIAPVTQIIYTTAFRDYAPEAFEKNATDYMLKPINHPRFLKGIAKVRQLLQNQVNRLPSNSNFFFVKSNIKGKFNRVDISRILYIENIGNYISIHMSGETITTYLTLADIMTKLPMDSFSRIHQSFIVSHTVIQSVEYNQVRLSDTSTLPVGATYRQAFRQKISANILISNRDQH